MATIGFTQNGESLEREQERAETEFDRLWKEVLDLRSAESRDAYRHYSHPRR